MIPRLRSIVRPLRNIRHGRLPEKVGRRDHDIKIAPGIVHRMAGPDRPLGAGIFRINVADLAVSALDAVPEGSSVDVNVEQVQQLLKNLLAEDILFAVGQIPVHIIEQFVQQICAERGIQQAGEEIAEQRIHHSGDLAAIHLIDLHVLQEVSDRRAQRLRIRVDVFKADLHMRVLLVLGHALEKQCQHTAKVL